MKRRSFLSLGALSLPAVATGLYETGFWPGRSPAFTYWSLPLAVQDLYDDLFVAALPELEIDGLLAILDQKQVLLGGKINVAQVQLNMATDDIIVYARSVYSESEFVLYALVARLRSRSLLGFLT